MGSWSGAVARLMAMLVLGAVASGCTITLERGPVTDFFLKDFALPTYSARSAQFGRLRTRLAPSADSGAMGGMVGAVYGGRRRAWSASVAGGMGGMGGMIAGDHYTRYHRDDPLPSAFEALVLAIPIISTDPNKGPKFGLLPVSVMQEGKRITNILAPDVTYNEIEGIGGTFRMRRSFSRTSSLAVDIGTSSEGAQDHDVLFQQRRLGPRENLFFRGRFWYLTTLANRFYGIGNDTEEDDESTYVYRRTLGEASLGLELPLGFAVELQERVASYKIGPGRLDDVASTRARYPDATGVNDRISVLAHRIRLTWDTRDSRITPTEGLYAELVYEIADDTLGSDVGFQRFAFSTTLLIPKFEKRFITALHFAFWVVDGERDEIPFYELTSVGGKSTIRGYGAGRFVDDNGYVLNVEERVNIIEFEIMGSVQILQLAAFLDLGRVSSEGDGIELKDVKLAAGGAVRLIIPDSDIVVSIDLGFSDEGSATFVGLDYPW